MRTPRIDLKLLSLALALGSSTLGGTLAVAQPGAIGIVHPDSIAPAAVLPQDPLHPDGAFTFGETGYIDFGDPGDAFDLAPDGGRTYAMWVYADTPTYHLKLLDKRGKSSLDPVEVQASGFVTFLHQFTLSPGFFLDPNEITDPDLQVAGAASSITVADGRWHHIAYTQQGRDMRIYVDGKLDVTYDIPMDVADLSTDNPLWFGWNGRANVHNTGLVDEISIWGRALTPKEIQRLMYTRPTPDAPGLTAFYPLDAIGPGGHVEDAGPNGYHGRAFDATVVPSSRPLGRPWTESPWAYALAAFAALAVLYGLMRGYAWRIERQRKRLQQTVDERTAELSDALATVGSQATQLQAQTAQLQNLDRAKSHFFQNVTHEFRTPLTLMLGPLDDIRAGYYGALSDPVTDQLDLARRNGRRLLALVTQILDIARLEAGQTPLRAQPLDLGAFVTRRAESFQSQAARKALALHIETPRARGEAPVTVWADAEHLERVVGNLLGNAVKYTPGGGAVRVSVDADAEGGTACLTVRDSGPGIPAAELPLVFDRFRRAGEGASQPVGTGIGLALTKELAELHGGTLTAESEEGSGSRFTLTLPLGRDHLAPDQIAKDPEPDTGPVDAALTNGEATASYANVPAAPVEAQQSPSDSNGEDADSEGEDVTTVLVVEDHDEVRAYVRRHLERPHPEGNGAGGDRVYRVIEAADGEAGLALARERLPDLVLSDVMMPGLDGLGLCRALKSDPETDFIPVVLLTAKAAPEDRLEGLAGEADDYLVKPFDPAELRARVANLIRQRQRLRERFRQEGVALVLGDDDAPLPAPVLAPDAVPDVPSADAAFLADVHETVTAHLGDEDFTVEALASEVGLSRSQLHRRLREVAGETPSAMIRTMRMARAARLLAAEAGTVAEVAYAVGYRSVSHFSNAFASAYGCRPSAYPDRTDATNGVETG